MCMIAITLFVTYAICDRISWFYVCLWYDIIDITRLLHMLYVVFLVLHGISSRAFTAIWYYTLCDRYAITMFLPAFFCNYK